MGTKSPKSPFYIYFACLVVCLYPINAKTALPIVPKFLLDLRWSREFAINKIQFWKILKIYEIFFYKIRQIIIIIKDLFTHI